MGKPKILEEIDNLMSQLAESQIQVSNLEVNKADKTEVNADKSNLQSQINTIVLQGTSGDSSAEVAQSRVDAVGNIFPTIKSHFDKIETMNQKYPFFDELNLTWTDSYYINNTGNKLAYAGLSYSSVVKIKKGETICVITNGLVANNVLIICGSTIKGTPATSLASVPCTGNLVSLYKFTGINDVTPIIITGATNTTYAFKIKTDYNDYNIRNDYELVTPTWINGYYIGTNLTITNGDNYQYSNPISLKKGDILNISCWNDTGATVLALCDIDGNLKQKIYAGTGSYSKYKYQATYDCYVIVSSYNLYDTLIYKLQSYIGKFESTSKNYMKLFNNIICMGDSLTEGFYNQGVNDVRPTISYPTFLQKIGGCQVSNAGSSGTYPTAYWNTIASGGLDYYYTNEYNNTQVRRTIPGSFSNYDTAIILLGQNQGLTDTLVADTTITEGQTYLNYASTNTGCYCKIIEKLKADNPNIIIFICTVPQNFTDMLLTNSVISQIAAKYKNNNVHLLDIYNNCIMTKTNGYIYRPVDDEHYGKIGYLTLAQTIIELICNEVNNNPTSFN